MSAPGGLLLVHAHPDDECFATGGLIARSVAEGRRVDLVVCTGGDIQACEDELGEAMVLLLERAKLVVEGAGAVGVAALLGGQVAPAATGSTVALLCGGNVDVGLLASLVRRHETTVGRRLVLFTKVSDRPGGPPAHVGLVSRVEPDGTALVLHRVARGVRRLRVNLGYPARVADPATGKRLNDTLVVGSAAQPAGSLVVAIATLL